MTMAHLWDVEQRMNSQSQMNGPYPYDLEKRLRTQFQEETMADITDFADFEGFYQSAEEKEEACKRHDAYQRIILQHLNEKHNPSINDCSQEKKETKLKVMKYVGKPLEQNKSKLGIINIHKLSKKEKLQLWELRDQNAVDASHSFVDDHVLWLKKTLDSFQYCFPKYRRAKSHSYTEFVEIVQAEFSANTSMFFNLFNQRLTTDFLHCSLPRSTKKKFTKSRLEKLLMKSPLFFYDQSHEVWHPIYILQRKSNAPEMCPHVHWLGILDIRKMWASKTSHTHGAEVRMECVKSVLNENSQMTVEEITEILCSYVEMPNCNEVTSIIHHMLQTSKSFRRCEDQGMEQVEESRYFKRAHTKSATPVTAVINNKDENSKSFLTWASIVSKYAMKESYEPAKHTVCITLKAKIDHNIKNNKNFPCHITSESAKTTSHNTLTPGPVASLSLVNQSEKISAVEKSKGEGIINKTVEEKQQQKFASTEAKKNSDFDQPQIDSISYRCVLDIEPTKDLVEICVSPEGAATIHTESSGQLPFSIPNQNSKTRKTNNILNKTQNVSRVSSDDKGSQKTDSSEVVTVDTECNASTLDNAHPVQSYQAKTLKTLRKPFSTICSHTLMNRRPFQECKSCVIGNVMKKDNSQIVPTGESHTSPLQLLPNTSEARILKYVNPPLLENVRNIEKNNNGSLSIPLSESNVKQKEENTAISLLANKDLSNISERIDIQVSVSSADSENRQETTRNVATVKKADLRNMQENSGMSTFPSVTDSRYLQKNTGKSAPIAVAYPSTLMENTGKFVWTANGKNTSGNTSISAPGIGSGTKAMRKNSDSSMKRENIGRFVPVMQKFAKIIPERTGMSTHVTLPDSDILEGISLYVPLTPKGSTVNLKGINLLSSDIVADSGNMEKHYGTSAHVTVMNARNVNENHKIQIPANQRDSESIQTNPITSVHVSKVDSQNTQEIVDKSVSVIKRDSGYMQENSSITATSTQRDAINFKKDASLLVPETEEDSKVVQEKTGITISSTQEQRHFQENAGISSPLMQKNSRITRKLPRLSVSVSESSIRNIHKNAKISESVAQRDLGNTGVNTAKKKSLYVAQENAKNMHENADIHLPAIKSDSRNIMENTNIPLSIALSATENTEKNRSVPVDHAHSRDVWEKTDACAHLTQEGSRCTEKDSSSCYSEDHTYSRHLLGGDERFTSCNLADSSKSLYNSCSAPLDTVASGTPKSECVSTRRRKLGIVFRMGCCNDTEHDSQKKRQKMQKDPFDPDAVEQYRLPLTMGWIREVVTRSISAKLETEHDIYYHSPLGKKLRSSVEVQKYLNTMKVNDLTIDNFTYKKNLLGFGEPYEVARFAKSRCAEDQAVTRPRRKGLCKNINNTSKVPISSYEEIPSSMFPDDGFWVTSFFDIRNNMGTDDVDIVNEAGEVTGYEEWLNISSLNKNCAQPPKKTENDRNTYDDVCSRLQHCIDLVNKDSLNVSVPEKDTGCKISHMNLEDMDVDVEVISNCGDDTESHTTLASDFAENEFEINPCEAFENQRSDRRYLEGKPFIYSDSKRSELQHAKNYKEAKTSLFVNSARSAKLYVKPQPHFEKEDEHCSLNLVPSIGSSRCGLGVSSTESANQRPDERHKPIIPVQLNDLQENSVVHASGVSKSCEIMRQHRKNEGIRTCINQRKMQLKEAVSNISKRNMVLSHNYGTLPVVTQIRDGRHTEEELELERNGKNVENYIENDKYFTGDNSEIKVEMQPMRYSESGTESSFLIPNLNKDIIFQSQNDLDRTNNDVSAATLGFIHKMNHNFITAGDSDCQRISETNPSVSNGTVVFSDKHELYSAEKQEKRPINENLVTSEHMRFGRDNYSSKKGKKVLAYVMPTQNGFIVPSEECIAASPQQNVSSGNLMNCSHNPQVNLHYLQAFTPVSQQPCIQNNGHISTMSREGINARLQQNTSPFNSFTHTLHKPRSQGCVDSVSLQNIVVCGRCKERGIVVCGRCRNTIPPQNDYPSGPYMPTSNGYMDTRLHQSMVVSNNCMETTPQTVPSFNGYLLSAPHQSMANSKRCMHSVGNSTHKITNCGYPDSVSLQNMTVCNGTSHTLPRKNKAVSITGTDSVTKKCIEVSTGCTNTIPQGNIAVSSDSMSNIPISVSSTCMNSTPSQNTLQQNLHLYSNPLQKMCLPGGKVNVMPMQTTVVTNDICNPLQNTAVPNSSMNLTPQTVPVVNGSKDHITLQSIGVTNKYMDTTRQCTHLASNYGYKDKISQQNVPVSCGVLHTLPQKNNVLSDNCTNSIPKNNCISTKNMPTNSNFMNTSPLLRIALSNDHTKNPSEKNNTFSNLQLHTNPLPKKSMRDASVLTEPAQNAVLSGEDLNAHQMAGVTCKSVTEEQDSILPYKRHCVPGDHGKTLCAENATLRQRVHLVLNKRPLQTQQYKFYRVNR